jgi:hypothetical protein
MYGAKVLLIPGRRDDMRELVIRVQGAGVDEPRLACASRRVRHVVVLDPGHFSAVLDRQFCGAEGEVVDDDLNWGAPRRCARALIGLHGC